MDLQVLNVPSSVWVQLGQGSPPGLNFSYSCNDGTCREFRNITSSVTVSPHVNAYWASDAESFLSQVLVYAFVGVVGGSLIAASHAILEVTLYHLFEFLHRNGKIQRLAPSIPVTMNNYRMEDFWSVAVWEMPVSAFLYHYRNDFSEKMKFSGDVIYCWLFAFIVMVLHDAYFYAVHTCMHKVKVIYRRVHSWHHSTRGDITVFSTAFGDVMDVAFTFGPFYFGVLYHAYRSPSWDPLAWVMLLWALNGVDMMGHSGYRLPAWIYVPGSLGVLLCPLAQTSKHHYIHHLDPRFNRSLYFTWWDRLGGTFREHHPKIEERSRDKTPS